MLIYVLTIILFIVLSSFAVNRILRSRNLHIWIWPYILSSFKRRSNDVKPVHIMFCFVDHYEPKWENPAKEVEQDRVNRWLNEYPVIASKYKDADGCFPKHTFFYPEEEYEEEYLEKIARLCSQGFGEIEIHLHHDDDTEENFKSTLSNFTQLLVDKHKALPVCAQTGKPQWSFIHGNWCLDNSRADGKWCGLNNEITLLKEIGCYADFTLPAAPDSSQTKKINSIYYAKDDPNKPKSHNTGKDVEVGGKAWGDIMIIQGPLCIVWKKIKGIVLLPKIENSDIRFEQPPCINRMKKWLGCDVHVKGREDWKFVKVHTHGAQERSMEVLLDGPLDKFFSDLDKQYNDGEEYILHYVTAREMYNIIKAAEAGEKGSPNSYRDYLIGTPSWT